MRRRLIVTALVAAVASIAPGAQALLFTASDTSTSTTWLCAGVEPTAGVCVDSPFQSASLPSAPILAP